MYLPYQRGMMRNHDNRLVAKEGYADIIRLSDGKVVRTIREFLAGQPFKNSVLYMTNNWVAIRYGWGVPLFHLWNDSKVRLTKSHALTPDEAKFILVRSKKVGVKSSQGDVSFVFLSIVFSDVRTTAVRFFDLAIRSDTDQFLMKTLYSQKKVRVATYRQVKNKHTAVV
jgi:hypothetical protein